MNERWHPRYHNVAQQAGLEQERLAGPVSKAPPGIEVDFQRLLGRPLRPWNPGQVDANPGPGRAPPTQRADADAGRAAALPHLRASRPPALQPTPRSRPVAAARA